MKLELLVCTIDDGIHNVKNLLLAPIRGVGYLISWQHSDMCIPDDIPNELKRDDVKVVHLEGRGLSRNRNNAICHATAELCLIADDDCTYKREYFETVIRAFDKNPVIDLITFQIKSNCETKKYENYSFRLNEFPKGYYASSIEIAFRRSVIQGRLQFNEMFGLGAPVLQSGEENLFIRDAVKYRLDCRYFPAVVVEHNHPTTTTTRIASPGVIMAEGAYIAIAYPWTCVPRLVLKAIRLNKKNGLGFFQNLNRLIQGIVYYFKNS